MTQNTPLELIQDIETNYFKDKLTKQKTTILAELNNAGNKDSLWTGDWHDYIKTANPNKDKADFEKKRGEILTSLAKIVIEKISQAIKTETNDQEKTNWKKTLTDYLARNKSTEEKSVHQTQQYKKMIDDISNTSVSGWDKVGFHQRFHGSANDPDWKQVGFCMKYWGS